MKIQDTALEGLDDKAKLKKLIETDNILDVIDPDQKAMIQQQCMDKYKNDRHTMADWLKAAEKAMRMAMQLQSDRTIDRSNIQYPLISQACITFNARALPTFIKGEAVAKPGWAGDRVESKIAKAVRLANHISFTALHGIDGWQEEFDRLLQVLPTLGHCYKKTWWNHLEGRIEDKLVMPQYLTLDNKNTKSIETTVTTEEYILEHNEIRKFEHEGIFTKGSLDKLLGEERDKTQDEYRAHAILQQNTWFDFDGDGLFEPYTVYMFKENYEVIGLEARYDYDDVIIDKDTNEVVDFNPKCGYTSYGFIPAFDGSFLHIGFGHLIGPLNSTVNTLYNQLLDAGSAANMQSGFLARSLNLGDGPVRVKRNQWLPVDATGNNLANSIFPLPAPSPSEVLFSLLGATVDMAKALTSTSDIMTGNQDAKGIPATTILAMIEQGMVLMTAIYKRIYRSMGEEFKIWQRMYKDNMTKEGKFKYGQGAWLTVKPDDYSSEGTLIVPIADPNMSSQLKAIASARALLELAEMNPNVNLNLISKLYVKALAIEDVDPEEIVPGEQGETPMAIELRRQNDIEQKKTDMDFEEMKLKRAETISKLRVDHATIMKLVAEAESKEAGTQIGQYQAQADKIAKKISDLEALEDQPEESENDERETAAGGEGSGAGAMGGLGEPSDDEAGVEDLIEPGEAAQPGDISDLRGPGGRARPPAQSGE